MLVARRWNLPILVSLLLAILLIASLYSDRLLDSEAFWDTTLHRFDRGSAKNPWGASVDQVVESLGTQNELPEQSDAHNDANDSTAEYPVVEMAETYLPDETRHRIIYSQTTRDRRYFSVDFAGDKAYNVNIIPHPTEHGRYLVIAQRSAYNDVINSSEEVICTAIFKDGVLRCPQWPTALPLALSIVGQCENEWAYTNLRRGPRDARVFYGPEAPYIIYGSQSSYVCLGLWVQDLRLLLDGHRHPSNGSFLGVTELRRPPPAHQIEKNYFLFWDNDGQAYAHYDIWPHRAFAELKHDGSAVSAWLSSEGLDLAPVTAEKDQMCMGKYMPSFAFPEAESIHQGTNSLSVTLCERTNSSCTPDDENTFVMHMFQHKINHDLHAVYEPYVVLFRRRAPFELYAISQRPLWYYGRDLLTEKTESRLYTTNEILENAVMPENHTELFYTTSMSWNAENQTYHGYIDDVILIGIGVEDTRSAGIDVLAKDLLQDMALC